MMALSLWRSGGTEVKPTWVFVGGLRCNSRQRAGMTVMVRLLTL
jgi:hypothetical protein